MCVLISCETGGESIPASLDQQLAGTTLSPDRDARWAARRWAQTRRMPLIENQYSAELIDVGRSIGHRKLFGPAGSPLSPLQRQELIETIHQPFRKKLEHQIERMLDQYEFVVHLSVRSFSLRSASGKLRRTDVGMLYDPSRENEVDLCLDWIDEMYDEAFMLKVRRNYPSRGTNDSLGKAMRQRFSPNEYLGIEVWLNRSWVGRPVRLRDEAFDCFTASLQWLTADVAIKAA